MRRPITATERRRLAVLGSPISHSKSPALHTAAYAQLGLDWEYSAIELAESDLEAFVATRDASWRGLSLTMPLKRAVLPLLDDVDPIAALTGGANTVVLGAERSGFNTDVYGIAEAFRAAEVSSLRSAQILGGGATAASAVVAVAELGAVAVGLTLRDSSKAQFLIELGQTLGLEVSVSELAYPDAVISTLPGHAKHALTFSEALRRSAVLFDVAYDPWPSTLAAQWLQVGGRVISGLEMLTLQALAQVRIFVNGSPAAVLDDELAVLSAMRRAVAA